MSKACPKCGTRVELPDEPHNPTPCPGCGTQVYPELGEKKKQEYVPVRGWEILGMIDTRKSDV